MHAKSDNQTMRVVGMATKSFDSDIVKWSLVISRQAPPNNLKSGYNTLSNDLTAIRSYFKQAGITDKELSIQPVNSRPNYGQFGQITGYSLEQTLFVLSPDIPKIEKIALNPGFFADKEVILLSSSLDYFYSKLPDLKKQLLAEATKDALDRSVEIASAAKTKIGKMTSAKAGIFQITEPYSQDVSDMGIYRTNTKQKDIRVTVTCEFQLR